MPDAGQAEVIFSPGDIVQLKSGGPAMTVVGRDTEGIRCIWYAETAEDVKSALVPAVCLDRLVLEEPLTEAAF